MSSKAIIRVFACFLSLWVVCAQAQAQAQNDAESLIWLGDWDSYHAYMAVLAEAYSNEGNGSQFDVKMKGTSRGIRGVYAGQADFGGAGRYRIQGLPEEMVVNMVPIAWDPLVVAVHPDNPAVEVSLDSLAKLYRGEIDNWKMLGGSDAGVRLIARTDDFSGVGYNLRKFLFGDGNVEYPTAELVDDEVSIADAVSEDVNGVGVVGFASAKAAGLKMLRLEGREPARKNITDGDYLFYRISYLVYHPSQGSNPRVKNFVRFAQSAEGRRVLRESGGIPFLDAPHLKLKEIAQDRRAYSLGFR